MPFLTAREKIMQAYEASGAEYRLRTAPLHSASQFVGRVVDAQVANEVAMLVLDPQEVSFFSHGRDGKVDVGPDSLRVLPCDSNLQKGGSTNGATSMAIEGLSFQGRGYRLSYATHSTGWGTALTDATVQAAMLGKADLVDPFGIISPPQLNSPFLLHDAIIEGLTRCASVKINLDTSLAYDLGLADLLPCSNASSYLHANGVPSKESRFDVPEGILWNPDGKADSDLEIVLTLHRPLVIPLSLVTMPGGNAAVAPTAVYVQTMLRVHGLGVGPTGEN